MRSVSLGLLALAAPVVLMSQQWPVHSMQRPRPPVVDPGPERPLIPAPSDAVVLFDGTDLSQWETDDSVGGPAAWIVKDGYMEVAPGSGNHRTRRGFGDVQLHIEWATPAKVEGHGQERGNSGLFMMGMYEIQILDSYGNDTYADGQAAALYGQSPPLVNACRPPGKWQTYDVVFHRPRFAADGSVTQPARVTLFHNGVLVQDNVAFTGRTAHARAAEYRPHGDRLPIKLQDHGNPMRFRNVWVRELPENP